MAERAAASRACPLDLHRLLPVPKRGQQIKRAPGLLWLGFWSADWTPWRALQQLRARWPSLRLEVRPLYDDP